MTPPVPPVPAEQVYRIDDPRLRAYMDYVTEYANAFYDSLPPPWRPPEHLRNYDDQIQYLSDNQLPPFGPPAP